MPRHDSPPSSYPAVEVRIPKGKAAAWEWVRRIASSVDGLMLGRSNNVISVTLEASATTTVVSDTRFTPDTVLLLEPVTANAAAVAIQGIWQAAGAGTITLTHVSDANTDLDFRAVYVG